MTKTSSINSRIEPELKKQVEAIFAELGLSTSDAITLFYKQVSLHDGLPFDVRIPNKMTQDAIDELESGGGTTYNSLAEALNDLNL